MGTVLGKRSLSGGSRETMSLPPAPPNSLQFLERCRELGAHGVQMKIEGDAHELRARAEKLGLWLEAMISVRHTTPDELEYAILQAQTAGCRLARDGLLGGRRYQTFDSLDDWNEWKSESLRKLQSAIPIFEKHRFTLALENHKDWMLDEYLNLFERYSSEYFGACLDFGNNLALLDDPAEVLQSCLPHLKATHCKDIAVAPGPDGFLLSEVPLGQGVLDLASAFSLIAAHKPEVHLSLEMITRDPLAIPCLSDHYFAAMPERSARQLARTLRFVTQHASPLPEPEHLTESEHARLEEANIRACFAWARAHSTP